MNKYIYLPIICMILLISCQSASDTSLPDNLDELRQLEIETKKELSAVEHKLTNIQQHISQLDPSAYEKPKKLVTGLKLSPNKFSRFIELQGSVESDETVHVNAESGGRLIYLRAKEGDRIAKGALVARVDLEAIDKQRAELQTSLDLAEQVYERQRRLWDQNIGTELQYLEAKNNVDRIKKSIERLDFEKSKSSIYAPISGEVMTLHKEQGEVVGPGEPIVTLLNTYKLKIRIDVPERLLPSLKRGNEVNVSIPAIQYNEVHKISRIGSTIDPNNRTIAVELDINNKNGLIKPNLLAIMSLVDLTIDDAIVIPTYLLQQEISGKYFVYAIDQSASEAPKAVKKYVHPGESYDGKIVISEGLNAEDVIIEQGANQVSAGDILNVEKIVSLNDDHTQDDTL